MKHLALNIGCLGFLPLFTLVQMIHTEAGRVWLGVPRACTSLLVSFGGSLFLLDPHSEEEL